MNDKKNPRLQNASDGNLQKIIDQEKMVKEIIKRKLESMQVYSAGDAELLSYRLAEIMVMSKRLYVELLSDFAETDTQDPDSVWEQVSGVRMHLLHMRDCIEDFESGLLEMMDDEKKEGLLDI